MTITCKRCGAYSEHRKGAWGDLTLCTACKRVTEGLPAKCGRPKRARRVRRVKVLEFGRR